MFFFKQKSGVHIKSKLILFAFTAVFILQGCDCCPTVTSQPEGAPANQVIQEFPSDGEMQTAWKVRWGHDVGEGLYITGAWFKKAPDAPWMKILYDARLSDIFVPYHSGFGFFDLSQFNFRLVDATNKDAGCCGTLLDDKVVKQVRNTGILWKDDQQVRHGEALVLWATLNAANYNYIMKYSFRDDGSIIFRLGATARNLPSSRFEAHMHTGLWRIDVDLNGYTHDTALLVRHIQTGDMANDFATPFHGGVEGGAVWKDEEFTRVRVIDSTLTNSHGRYTSYDLMPLRRGTARHIWPFTKKDFWVTQYQPMEVKYRQITEYVSEGEPITDTDIVLWYISSAHHHPRNEDGEFVDGFWEGSALVMWTGFKLRPRNLFNGTPLYPAEEEEPAGGEGE